MDTMKTVEQIKFLSAFPMFMTASEDMLESVRNHHGYHDHWSR
jgi:hypothetical protein